jgi:hypothetical protein
MTEDGRGAPSTLKGRLADVYVPALVEGALDGLSKRLGNRATVDDPLYGRASSLASLEPMLGKASTWFRDRKATYRHVYSTTGVDRDAAEGILALTIAGTARELPIAVVAERRRLREIELRIYYTPEGDTPKKQRPPLVNANPHAVLPQQVATVLDALRKGSFEEALAGFEENARAVDPHGTWHHKRDGAMANYFSELGALDLAIGGAADDGRACCVEATVDGASKEGLPALLSLERGDSGLFRELRFYRG